MNTPTLYLMSKYSGREAECLKENQDAWLALDAKGYLVYSPICESHNVEEHRKETGQLMMSADPHQRLIQCKYEAPDYVARDLRLIESWCSVIEDDTIQHLILDMTTEMSHPAYQPKVVGVVLPSGLSTVIDNEGNPQWSKGVRMEYEFMQSHHILVISLETALTVPPEQWKEYGLWIP